MAVAAGDKQAVVETYGRYRLLVYRAACRHCGESLAEEATQDVFVDLWSQPQKFDPSRGSLPAYLCVKARSRAVDLLRSDSARRAREAATLVEQNADSFVEDVVLHRTTIERVCAILYDLPAGQCQAIALAYFGGYPYRQVATFLGDSEGTVKGRIRAGLHTMRARVSSE